MDPGTLFCVLGARYYAKHSRSYLHGVYIPVEVGHKNKVQSGMLDNRDHVV